jgi:hypothetical protein
MALTVVRLGADGQEIWTSRFGSSRAYDYGLAAVELASGGYLVAGGSNNRDSRASDIWIHRVDETGSSTATYWFGGSGPDWPGGICLSDDGAVIVTGITSAGAQGGYDLLLLEVALE